MVQEAFCCFLQWKLVMKNVKKIIIEVLDLLNVFLIKKMIIMYTQGNFLIDYQMIFIQAAQESYWL